MQNTNTNTECSTPKASVARRLVAPKIGLRAKQWAERWNDMSWRDCVREFAMDRALHNPRRAAEIMDEMIDLLLNDGGL